MSEPIDAVIVSLKPNYWQPHLQQITYLQRDADTPGDGHYRGQDRTGDVDYDGFKIIAKAQSLSHYTFDPGRSAEIDLNHTTPDMALVDAYLENEIFLQTIYRQGVMTGDRRLNVHGLGQMTERQDMLRKRLDNAYAVTGLQLNQQQKNNIAVAVRDIAIADVGELFGSRRAPRKVPKDDYNFSY